MQKVIGKVRAAVERYNMIEEGDRIAVGVSGGKDSLFLLCALAKLKIFYPKKFEIVAITIDPCFGNENADFSEVEKLCESLGVPYVIRRTELGKIIFEYRKEENPCSLCARMRRGMLHDMTKEAGCNKIALGHHHDDAAETFMMNLLYGGKIGCFSPVTYLSVKDITMIRPLIFMDDNEVQNAVNRMNLPVVKSKCPEDGVSKRAETTELIKNLEKEFPDIKNKITGAMQRAGISGW